MSIKNRYYYTVRTFLPSIFKGITIVMNIINLEGGVQLNPPLDTALEWLATMQLSPNF